MITQENQNDIILNKKILINNKELIIPISKYYDHLSIANILIEKLRIDRNLIKKKKMKSIMLQNNK